MPSVDQPRVELFNLDCRDAMDLWLARDSIDSIVTDPPYGLSFMNRAWDHGIPGRMFWQSAIRVLKPGAYLLAFGGTRTYHRLACAIEDAGFEIRDQMAWAYGQGMPKSRNGAWGGTALKPAWEPICLARKPLIGTVEANWLVYGTGGLNIDSCRVETDDNLNGGAYAESRQASTSEWAASGSLHKTTGKVFVQPAGRWPANLMHDGSDEVIAVFPDAKGQMGATGKRTQGSIFGAVNAGKVGVEPRGDTGSAARFFFCPKASKRDKDEGLDTGDSDVNTIRKNNHPTVKPTELMRYLCRLVTPAGGVVLDPFMGSGSTGKAAVLEGFQFIGIDVDPSYVEVARNRIAHASA